MNGAIVYSAILAGLIGLGLALWGLRLWLRPNSLRPHSPMYRWIYFRFFSWGREPDDSIELTDGQIKRYALGTMITGILIMGGTLIVASAESI